MQLVTFTPSRGTTSRPGIRMGGSTALGGKLIDIPAALEWAEAPVRATEMIQLIEKWDELKPFLDRASAAFREGKLPTSCVCPEPAASLISPLPRPVSMRDGYAFRQHVEAARRNRGLPMIAEFDHFPIFYFTNHLAVTGPGKVEVQRLALSQLDFELEVAAVLAKGGKNIAASRADEHILGFCIMNDWSARTLQMEEMKLNLGPAKGKDFATSLGPYLVTREELASHRIPGPNGERYDLRMRAYVNGKQVSEGNLKDMTWTFGQILERASYGVHLHPGEVIGSGTVGTGCFLELNGSKLTDHQWLRPGDEVVLEVDGLGKLSNTIIASPSDL